MKKIIFIMLIFPLFAFAETSKKRSGSEKTNPNKKNIIELTLDLKVHRVCTSDNCISIYTKPTPVKINLEPEDEDCHPQTPPELCLPWSYVGRWSDVAELDGIRYIGIVTVRKNIIGRDSNNKPIGFNYSMTVEILGDKGVEAKTRFNDIKDIKKLDAITVATIEKEVWGRKYFADLYVGDKSDGSTTIPYPPIPIPTPDCNDIEDCSSKSEGLINPANIEKGRLYFL